MVNRVAKRECWRDRVARRPSCHVTVCGCRLGILYDEINKHKLHFEFEKKAQTHCCYTSSRRRASRDRQSPSAVFVRYPTPGCLLLLLFVVCFFGFF